MVQLRQRDPADGDAHPDSDGYRDPYADSDTDGCTYTHPHPGAYPYPYPTLAPSSTSTPAPTLAAPETPNRASGQLTELGEVSLDWNDAARAQTYEAVFWMVDRWVFLSPDRAVNGVTIAFDGFQRRDERPAHRLRLVLLPGSRSQRQRGIQVVAQQPGGAGLGFQKRQRSRNIDNGFGCWIPAFSALTGW